MSIRVWKLGLAALGGTIVACSGGGHDGGVAGSSMETENSIAFSATLADGTPAARMNVRVRPVDFIAAGEGVDALDSTLFIDDITDEKGFVSLKTLKRGDYRIEIGNDSLKGTDAFAVELDDEGKIVVDSLNLTVAEPGSVVGQVELPEGQKFAMVAIVGLDYYAKTDSQGFFEFKSLPAGEFSVLALSDDYVSMGSAPADVRSGDSVNVRIELPEDTTPNQFVFEDFEDGVDEWTVRVFNHATGDLEAVEDEVRKGMVAYFKSVNDSNLGWVLMGNSFGGSVDMSNLDSVVFYAKGLPKNDSARIYLSFSFDVNVDSTADYESGKAWVHYDLTPEWKRYVVAVPDSFVPADSNRVGGNIGWDAVKSHITNISIFGGIGGEIWIDDITMYGYRKFEVQKDEKVTE